ncbi:filensin isoform X2 [Brachyhypopomus gauderio]|uniref:filensin isoform X2 n=1 Tax=Brachyhypopomus gauderio TaxID=698409 RepID=UPI0040436809
MFETSYVRKEKNERSEEPSNPEHETAPAGSKPVPDRVSMQDLDGCFARYASRARALETRNAVLRKQLETLRRVEEADGLEASSEQIRLHRQRVLHLHSDHTKLLRELKDAERKLHDFSTRYRNECQFQEQLCGTLEQLNKEADAVLLMNLEHQMEAQFLQDDISSTTDRHKKNLAEIETYLNILHQINQEAVLMANVSMGVSEERPRSQSQLEESNSALCQLRAQPQGLQAETTVLEQTIRTRREEHDDEIQLFSEQIKALGEEMEEPSLEKCTNQCQQLSAYQTSLESELDPCKKILEDEDDRLNSAIIGTPISLLATNYRHTHGPTVGTSQGKDITQAIQDIANVKPRQKQMQVCEKKVHSPVDLTDVGQEEEGGAGVGGEVRQGSSQDVPDGAQISKALDTLCNIIHDRMRRYRKPEPIADFYTQGRYILVTGDSSYQDPCFCTSTPSAGRIIVTICHDMFPPNEPDNHQSPTPISSPSINPGSGPTPLAPPTPSQANESRGKEDGDNGTGGNHEGRNRDRHRAEDQETTPKPEPDPKPCPSSWGGSCPAPQSDPAPDPSQPSDQHGDKSMEDGRWLWGLPPLPNSSIPPDSMSYEKVEVIEAIEKLSPDKKVKRYEETAVVVETMIEKTRKKKIGNRVT